MSESIQLADQTWVLIVEDEASTREGSKAAFQKHYPLSKVVTVTNGHEALSKIEKQRFDLVVLPYEYPTEGVSTLMNDIARLEQQKKPFGVIVGFSRENEIPKLGRAYFLQKPFETSAMIGAAREVFEAKAKSKQWEAFQQGGDHPSAAAAKEQLATAAHGKVVMQETGALTSPGADANANKASIDVNFINPFIEGAVVVLETVCETKSVKESLFARKEDSIRGDISAVIAMNSSKKQGSFAISFEKRCFLAAAGRMLGETYTEVNDENKDVVGEICNQIFGYAKRKLNNEQGYDIQPAIPSIITGDGHQIRHLVKGLVIAAKFKTDEGFFIVEAAIPG